MVHLHLQTFQATFSTKIKLKFIVAEGVPYVESFNELQYVSKVQRKCNQTRNFIKQHLHSKTECSYR